MPVYKNSKVTSYYGNGSEMTPCEVRISDGTIAVSYKTASGLEVYEGKDQGGGFYRLRRVNASGTATFYHIVDEDTLIGTWFQDSDEGMWRIDLLI